MKLIKGNIWETPCQNICITTNNVINRVGNAIWGAGIAKQAKDKWPQLPMLHARFLRQRGHIFGYLMHALINDKQKYIYTFPTKLHWKDKSNLDLIIESAEQLKSHDESLPERQLWSLPFPGIGCGGLNKDEVLAAIEPILTEDNFWIYTL